MQLYLVWAMICIAEQMPLGRSRLPPVHWPMQESRPASSGLDPTKSLRSCRLEGTLRWLAHAVPTQPVLSYALPITFARHCS